MALPIVPRPPKLKKLLNHQNCGWRTVSGTSPKPRPGAFLWPPLGTMSPEAHLPKYLASTRPVETPRHRAATQNDSVLLLDTQQDMHPPAQRGSPIRYKLEKKTWVVLVSRSRGRRARQLHSRSLPRFHRAGHGHSRRLTWPVRVTGCRFSLLAFFMVPSLECLEEVAQSSLPSLTCSVRQPDRHPR